MKTFISVVRPVLFAAGLLAGLFASGKPAEPILRVEDSLTGAYVEILDFGSQAIDNRAIQLWCKASIKGNYTIGVEYSRDGADFVPVGNFNTKGILGSHFLTDAHATRQTNYYRLKITDGLGNHQYSKLMLVQRYHTQTVTMVSVTPNPSVNDIHITVQLKENAFVLMKVKGAKGEDVMQKRVHGAEGLNQYELEGTNHLRPGNYSLQIVINSKESLSVPLIKS